MRPYVYLSLLFFATLLSCARPVMPTGGPRDTTPPRLVLDQSTPNRQTNFNADRIEMTFDEWVVLSDVSEQVVVSPPLPGKKSIPEVTLRGKTVTVKFDKDLELRPNTTYSINMGTAVKDLHEGNPADDLVFVFSTGPFIDSLEVKGRVKDAFTDEPVDKAVVMLYEDTRDSAVMLQKPYYFARSKSGAFFLRNLSPGTYRCIVIEDNIPNLKWDGSNERIGFLDEPVVVTDTTPLKLDLRMFQEIPPLKTQNRDTSDYGVVKLGFTAPVDSIPVRTADSSIKLFTEYGLDSVTVWYDKSDDQDWLLFIGEDTLEMPGQSRSRFLENHQLQWATARPSGGNRKKGRSEPVAPQVAGPIQLTVNPFKPARLVFNAPVAGWDTSKWVLQVDSSTLRQFSVSADSVSPVVLGFSARWKSGGKHQLSLLPGGVTDIWGTSNTDTLFCTMSVTDEKQFSTLTLTVDALAPSSYYVLELIDQKTVVEQRAFQAREASMSFTFPGLQPKAYTARLTNDSNGNGRWDPGNFMERRQPETFRTKNLPQLRANWVVEERW